MTKKRTFKQARSEIIKAIAKADGSSTSVTYMVLRGEAMCPMRKCLQAFAQVLPNVGIGQIMAAAKRDGCVYRSNGYGFRPKAKSNSKAKAEEKAKVVNQNSAVAVMKNNRLHRAARSSSN